MQKPSRCATRFPLDDKYERSLSHHPSIGSIGRSFYLESFNSGSTGSGEEDPQLERKIWQKLDLCLVPLMAMFFFLSFLDRVNLGSARMVGLHQNIRLTDFQFSVALTVTYVAFVIAALPATLLLKAIRPNFMLPALVIWWGVVATLQGVVRSYSGLLACRFFLGLAEGGLNPCIAFYLTMFYPRNRLQIRLALFYTASSLSGAFSCLLAYAIANMQMRGERPGWAWIFILEGLLTVIFGLVSAPFLPRDPDHVPFFSTQEKRYIHRTMVEDGMRANFGREAEDAFSWKEIRAALSSVHAWLLFGCFFCNATILYSLSFFAPSIVECLGFEWVKAQLMTVPPFALAFFVTMVGSYLSDRYLCRSYTTIISAVFGIVGFAVFLGVHDFEVRYASLFISFPGTYLCAPTITAWVSNNFAPHARRATAIAFCFIAAHGGAISATWLMYLNSDTISPNVHASDTPRYTMASIVLLVLSAMTGVFAFAARLYLIKQNQQKEAARVSLGRSGARGGDSATPDEGKTGDRSIWFDYIL